MQDARAIEMAVRGLDGVAELDVVRAPEGVEVRLDHAKHLRLAVEPAGFVMQLDARVGEGALEVADAGVGPHELLDDRRRQRGLAALVGLAVDVTHQGQREAHRS